MHFLQTSENKYYPNNLWAFSYTILHLCFTTFPVSFHLLHNALPKWKLYSRNNGTDVIRQSPRQNSNKFQQQMETSLKRKKVKLVQWKLIFNQELIHAFSCEYNEVKFAEQERGVGIARGATMNNTRFLSAL